MGICYGYSAVTGIDEPFVQLRLSNWTTEIELSPPTEPRSLLDPFDSERGIRSTREIWRAHLIQQPITNVTTG